MDPVDWHRDGTCIHFQFITFKKRDNAIKYADAINSSRMGKNEDLTAVFSREITTGGHRYFFVEDLSTFYKKYMLMTSKDRTIYEIIRPYFPCRLYFDIEFDKRINPGRDGENSMTIFKRYLIMWVEMLLGFHITAYDYNSVNPSSSGIVELDASNSTKFSRHLIVSLPGDYAFANVNEVFKFVNMICNHITKIASWDTPEETTLSPDALSLRQLFFMKQKDQNIHKTLFVDLVPYKSFQNFRLVLSSKFEDIGKRNLNIFLPKENKIMEESLISQDFFNATLVSFPALKNNVSLKCVSCPLSFSSDIESSVKIVADVGSHEQRKKMKLSNVKTGRDAGKLFPRLINHFENHIAKSWPTECDGHSHVRESPNARIYNIIYYDKENPGMIVAIANNNYCLNIQRRHVKNNIFFQISLWDFF